MALALFLLFIAGGDSFLIAGSFPTADACNAAAAKLSATLSEVQSEAIAFCAPAADLDRLRGVVRKEKTMRHARGIELDPRRDREVWAPVSHGRDKDRAPVKAPSDGKTTPVHKSSPARRASSPARPHPHAGDRVPPSRGSAK